MAGEVPRIFFTGDTHFGDHRTINIHKRPFASVAEMDDMLIRRWNECVGSEDEVWHLGDFARTAAIAKSILPQLNGRKHLIRGNNDPEELSLATEWVSVNDYREVRFGDRLLVLCHYPFRSWNGQHRRSIDVHGHSHGRLKPQPRQVDVGVDAWDFRPISLDEVLDAVSKPGSRQAPSR